VTGDEIYESMIQSRGAAYRESQIKPYSHYRDPIDCSPGRAAGNSHVWGDASAEVQSKVVDALITASGDAGLSTHATAHVLAIARVESGFNPDAAAGTTSAHGLGQFIDRTGAHYGINDSNRGDVNKQAEALVSHYQDNAALARARGQSEDFIYKYHHDGPTQDYGGLGISQQEVMPYLDQYEQFVKQHQQHNIDPLHELKELGQQLQQGTMKFGPPRANGLPDYLRVNHSFVAQNHPSIPNATPDGALHRGDHGAEVRTLQEDLNKLATTNARGSPLAVDGVYGKDTRDAVENFQLWHGLPTTGIADRRTLDAVHDPRLVSTPARPEDAADLNRHETSRGPGAPIAPGPVTSSPARTHLHDPRNNSYSDPNLQPSPHAQAHRLDHIPPHHPDYALFASIRERLPAGTSEEMAAHVALEARIGGIRFPATGRS